MAFTPNEPRRLALLAQVEDMAAQLTALAGAPPAPDAVRQAVANQTERQLAHALIDMAAQREGILRRAPRRPSDP